MLTSESLHQMVHYSPETGEFRWLVTPGRRIRAGDQAGYVDERGYVRLRLRGKAYRAHRLAWIYMTGEAPPALIDHADGNTANNRWANLREATPTQNCANSARRNACGYKGVKKNRAGRFEASIRVDGRRQHLGTFNEARGAHAAYLAAAQSAFGEFARG